LVGGAATGGLICYLNEKREEPEEFIKNHSFGIVAA